MAWTAWWQREGMKTRDFQIRMTGRIAYSNRRKIQCVLNQVIKDKLNDFFYDERGVCVVECVCVPEVVQE